MPWLAEKMLDGQHQRVDIPAHTRTSHKGLLQNRLTKDLCWLVPGSPPTTQSVKGLNRVISYCSCMCSSSKDKTVFYERYKRGRWQNQKNVSINLYCTAYPPLTAWPFFFSNWASLNSGCTLLSEQLWPTVVIIIINMNNHEQATA